jgi:cholinesterase
VPSWRYRYFGEFPNLNPLPWLGAYHSSTSLTFIPALLHNLHEDTYAPLDIMILTCTTSGELPMVFGTSDLLGPNTELEKLTSQYMQKAWLAFVKDPYTGLLEYGWPEFNASSKSLVQLGYEGNVSAIIVTGNTYDTGCI